ncbi:MAG: T9SS type A sorting domain-containing protein [Bacteroidia bacterium]
MGSIGEGLVPDEINSNESCLGSGERNSTWMEIPIISSGRLAFSIVPSGSEDYDFIIFDLTNANCSEIFWDAQLAISCSFSGSTFPTGATGPNDGLNIQDEEGIEVEAGDRLMLCVTNFTGFTGGGFNIQFGPTNTCLVGSCNSITGKVFLDSSSNCEEDQNEIRIPRAKVGIIGNNNTSQYDTYTNEEGIFNLIYPLNLGDVVIGLIPTTPFFDQLCAPVPSIIPESSTAQNIVGVELAANALLDCYQLQVNHSNAFMRNCLVNTRLFTISNIGSQTSEPTALFVNYPSYLFPISNSPNLTYFDPHSFQFSIPSIPAFSQFQFTIQDSVDCETPPQFEACVTAWLENPSNCGPSPESASLKIIDNCDFQSSNRNITVINIGESEVSEASNIQLRSNGLILLNEQLNLLPGEEITYENVDLTYSTLYINRELNNQYIASLTCDEGQLNEFYYVDNLMFPQLSEGSTVCDLVRNSYDPNDKTGFPAGEGAEHLISKNDRLKYRIRFQNTGNDTAYKVVIRDTLPGFLDESSVVLGMSSHPFRHERHSNELIFIFDPIALIDSATNVEASQGFVEFNIIQKADNPESYIINNSASIYFDFNDPIITNTYSYTVEPLVGLEETEVIYYNVFPNPGKDVLNIQLDNFLASNKANTQVKITDLSGRVVMLSSQNSNFITVQVSSLVSGLYFIEVYNGKTSFGVSKWVKD